MRCNGWCRGCVTHLANEVIDAVLIGSLTAFFLGASLMAGYGLYCVAAIELGAK